MIDQKIFYLFNSIAGNNQLLDSFIVFIASSLPWILICYTLIYFIFIQKNPRKLFIITLVVLTSALITEFLKWVVFQEPRPFLAMPNVTTLINIIPFGSFPSQHATIFSALATIMFIYNKKTGVWFILFCLLIGISRIVAGIHYPSDILTGFFIGFTVTYFMYKIYRDFMIFLQKHIS